MRLHAACGSNAIVASHCAVMGKRAKPGEALPAASLSKMVGLLRYRSSNCKDDVQQDAAKQALHTYQTLSNFDDRRRFLDEYEANGSGKGPNSLKFALEFNQTLTSSKRTAVGFNENMLTRQPTRNNL